MRVRYRSDAGAGMSQCDFDRWTYALDLWLNYFMLKALLVFLKYISLDPRVL